MAFQYKCGTTLDEVAFWLKIPKKTWRSITSELLSEGYTVRGICYAAAMAEDKLTAYIGDPKFGTVFKNEVRKYALKPGDPRWENGRR